MITLITGANGFFGTYLTSAFNAFPHDTLGLNGCAINVDLSKDIPVLSKKYTKIIHAAGKAHSVPNNPEEEELFFNVNLNGTINLTTALDQAESYPEQFIFISTVGVYGREKGNLLDEETSLLGHQAYQKSKIEAENHLLQWATNHNIQLTILRLPLLVGKNPPGNLGHMIKAIRKGYYFRLGQGNTSRSMVLAEDVASLIASDKIKPGIFNLTDGYHPTYRELDQLIAEKFNKKIRSVPASLLSLAASIGDLTPVIPINSYKLNKLQSTLTFSDKKARLIMGWNPRPVLDNLEI